MITNRLGVLRRWMSPSSAPSGENLNVDFRGECHCSRSVETKEYIFFARVYGGVARPHFGLMGGRTVSNAKELRMTLFSRRAAARLAATAGIVLALSAPWVAQSLDRQDGMGR